MGLESAGESASVLGPIAVGLVVGLGVGAILLALGDRVRCWLRLPVQPGVRPAVAFAFGSWALGVAVLLAGLVGLFRPVPIVVLTGLAAAAGRWRAIPGLARRLRGPSLAALPLLPVALAPPFFYDSWVYHLGLPWQALQDHAIRAHPGNMFSTFPPLAQLIYALPLAASAFRAAGLIHLIGYVTAASTVSSIARRYGASRAASFLAGAAILYLPKVMLVPALPAAEAWSLTAITASVAIAMTSRPARKAAAGAGLLAGVACAARLQGLPWAMIVAMIVAVRSVRLVPRTLPAFGLAVAAGAAPWWAKNALLLGHPIAPMGWHLAGVDALWRDAASNLNLATGPADLLARVSAALSGTAGLAAPLLAVGIVAYFMERRFPKLLLLAAGVAGLVAWSLTGALDRFLAPSIALLVAAAAASWPRRLGCACAIVTLSGVLAWGLWDAQSMWSEIGGLKVAGRAETVYASTVVNDPSPAFRACASLPPDARLLLVGEPRGFLLPRAFETTSQCDSSLLAPILERTAPAAAGAELRGLGYTHLLINVREMSRLGPSYPVLPWTSPEGRNRFVELTGLLGKPVVLESSVVVYDLREATPGPH